MHLPTRIMIYGLTFGGSSWFCFMFITGLAFMHYYVFTDFYMSALDSRLGSNLGV